MSANPYIKGIPVAQWASCKRWSADLEVPGSTPAGSGNLFIRRQGSVAQRLSLTPSHRPGKAEILFKKDVKPQAIH